ncbi:hypothetical protein EV1_030286 [Malus domestica]
MLIFSNALYFKSLWSNKFDTWKTKRRLLPPSQLSRQEATFFDVLIACKCKIWAATLVERVCFELGFLDRHHPLRRVEVGDFKIPRFKFSFAFKASDILKDLGLVLHFNAECDLIEMLDSSPIGAKIYHKSLIEVDEQGTKAVAA